MKSLANFEQTDGPALKAISPQTVCAIIPAAGFSRRMGQFKPLLKLGDVTVLERQVNLFRSIGIGDIRVVTGFRADALKSEIRRLNVREICNENYPQGMFSSVIAAIRSLKNRPKPFFFLPVDIATIRPATLLAMLALSPVSPKEIRYPLFCGQRGHPPLIDGGWANEIVAFDGDGGLAAFLTGHDAHACDVPVFDEGVLLDMDTPESYAAAIKRIERLGIPSERESKALLNHYLAGRPDIKAHCRKVAHVAGRLASALDGCNIPISHQQVIAAGLLHDIARTRPHHARLGARLLERHGFFDIAGPVRSHMDIRIEPGQPISAAEVVYLADKLVEGARRVTVEERFAARQKAHAHTQQAAAAIKRRFVQALLVQQRLETATGMSIAQILNPEKDVSNEPISAAAW